MKLLIDMNLSPLWVPALRNGGFEEVAHWADLGSPSAPDEVIFAYARREGFVILTLDLDFSALLAHTAAEGPSVVQIRAEDVTPSRLGATVVESIKTYQDALATGALLSIDTHRAKIRLLPLSGRPPSEGK